jgi:hypothetical protein
LRLNNAYWSKASWDNLTGYIRRTIEISPEEVIADARNAAIAVSSVDEFRSLTPQERVIIDQLMSHYVNQAAKWCAFTGATSGVGGVVTAVTLGAADFIHIAGRLYRLCLRLAILYGFDPGNPVHRDQIEEIYLSSLGLDHTKEFILGRFLGRSTARPGTLSSSLSYTKLIIAVGRKLWARRLTSRITGRFLPLFGATVGAGSNYLFAKKAGRRMKENFQRISP